MPKRVREKYKANPCALFDPGSGAHIVPDPTKQYGDDEPLVLSAPWYFIDEGQDEDVNPGSVAIADVRSEIEQATAAPGEKRPTRRRIPRNGRDGS
jgi:hypothetical protein